MAQAPPMICDQARELLRSAEIMDSLLFGKFDILSALNHYSACRDCLCVGLAKIVSRTLTCQEAVEAYFQFIHPTNMYLSLMAGEIWQYLVYEHIWGQILCLNPDKPDYKKRFEEVGPSCNNPVCHTIKENWDLGFGYPVPLDLETYGELVTRLPLRIRPLMVQQGWSVKKIDQLVRGWHV